MIEFLSEDFINSCKEELELNGYCYLVERLSRQGGNSIDYFIQQEEDLVKLPVNKQSLWEIKISTASPILARSYLRKSEGEIDLQHVDEMIFDDTWIYKASVKLKALVYTDGQPVLGAY